MEKKNLWKILFKDYTSSPITTSSQFVCSIITKFYQHIQALVFAVKEINENPKLLPNITLGFHIYDSFYDARMAYRSTLDLLFKSYAFLPNYKCGIQNNFIGFIGGLTSDISSCMADILTVFKVPQVRPKELKSWSWESVDAHTMKVIFIKSLMHQHPSNSPFMLLILRMV